MEHNTIRWKAIKKYISQLTGVSCEITLSTHMIGEDVISAVLFNKDKAEIVLSSMCKDKHKIYKAIAHEVAHILCGTADHSKKFDDTWDDVYKKLMTEEGSH